MTKKREMDLVNGSLGDKIIFFALPLAATGILQQLFNAADIAVVGRFVGKHAMAAVGSNAPTVGLMINLFVGISMGTNVVIARFTGEGNAENIRKSVHTAIVLAVAGGLGMCVLGELIIEPLLCLMGVPGEIYDLAVLYMRVYMIGLPVILLYNFESAIFRSQGDTRTPLICLTISGVINVILNVYFVIVLGMTSDGVALATVISNLVSSALLFYYLRRTKSAVHVEFSELRIHMDVLRHMLQIGVPAGVQSMVFSLANMCVQSAVNSLGPDAVAGSAAAFNVEIISFYLVNSFGQACTTFIGQNYGAGKPGRCVKTLRLCLIQDLVVVAAAASVILTFGTQILGIFNTDPLVVHFGMIRLRYILGAHLFSVFVEVVSGAMRGYGYSAWPALVSLFGICGIRITWICTIFRIRPSFATLMTVYPVSIALTAVAITISYLYLQRTRLRKKML